MKKVLFFIGTLVIASVFMGCGKDEEKGNPEALIGTWEYESAIYIIDGQTIPMEEEYNETITFYADGKVESSEDGVGTYTTKGYSITLTFTDKVTGKPLVIGPGQSFVWSGKDVGFDFDITGKIKQQTYSVQGNKLIITVEIEASAMGQNMTLTTRGVYKKVVS